MHEWNVWNNETIGKTKQNGIKFVTNLNGLECGLEVVVLVVGGTRQNVMSMCHLCGYA